MRLKRLDLKAFGPFTERSLDFNSKDPGLHIIFGPNEAGKSSSLRALKSLLYGFPQQTPDNFIHSYDQLLVGGCLEDSAGTELSFQRRKKRIGDIIDETGKPLDITVLSPFLQGVEPEIFESLYGIDHDGLVRGGEEILAQKGEVGQALFAAGAGISSLREVINQLEKDAAELFKSAGQLPEINRAIKRFKELKKEAKSAVLSARKWRDHKKSLENGEAERAALEKDRDQKNKELHRLGRLDQAVPELASLKSMQEQLQAMGEVVILGPDFDKKFQEISQEMRDARLQLQRDSEHQRKREEKRREISVNKDLLNQAERIDDFHQRLGEYRKGQKDKPERNGMRISLRKEAGRLLQQVRPDLNLEEVETLRTVVAKKRTIQTLSSRYEVINQKLSLAKKQREAAALESREVEKSLAQLEEAKESRHLLQAVKLAHKSGDIDALLEKMGNDLELNRKEWLTELTRIGLWSGNQDALLQLPLPLSETVQKFENSYVWIGDEKRIIELETKKNNKELNNVRTEIKKVEYAGKIPSENELTRSREKRQQGWKLIQRQWLDHEDVTAESKLYSSEQSLPNAYEGFVGQADNIADRLRREADRVAHAAALLGKEEILQEALTEIDSDRARLVLRSQELDKKWSQVWQAAGIQPLSPKEMVGWLAEMDKLRFRATDIFKKEIEIRRIDEDRKALQTTLTKELNSLGEQPGVTDEKLGPVLVLAETLLEKIGERNSRLEKLKEKKEKSKKTFTRAEEDLKSAKDALADWNEQWQTSLLGLTASSEVSPLEALDLIDILQSCFDQLKEAEELQKRINGIDRDATDLALEVKTLLEEVAPDIPPLPLDQAIMQLRTRLSQASKDSTLYDKLSEELDSLQADVSGAEKTLKNTNEQMAILLQKARCEKVQEVAVVISRFNGYQRLLEKISDTETVLARIGAGVPFEELARQAAEIDADELPGLRESLTRDIEDRIHGDISRISQVIGEENSKLASMDGGTKAAEIAEEMEQELARIRRLADKYVQVKLASRVLQQEIELYREQHQDPVLKIGSRYFSQLTLSSFAGLHTDVDDKGEPILVGVRPDNLRLTVDKMSSGTRDQLFLALRLATLEWRLETSEAVPFIVDDILINFDDDRSRATLLALANLSRKNQVILFTHHRQIVEAANTLQTEETVQIHEL